MRSQFLFASALASVFAGGGCSYVSLEEGRAMQEDIAKLKARSTKADEQSAQLKKATIEAEAELKKLRQLLDEARTAIKSSADLGTNLQKVQVDLASLAGRLDDMQNSLQGLSKNFTEFRATSDVKLEQVVNATTNSKAPPIPESADAVFNEAQKRYGDKQYTDARRLWEAFLSRYPNDARAPKAQYLVGESYLAESKWANAIQAFTKVIDNFPKSEMVPDAMYKNGTAFYALKYCGDARIYFQELLRRYPKTEWKKDANDQLKKLAKDAKDKAVCQS